MKTTFAKSPLRSPSYTKFATPLVLDPPPYCDLATILLGWGKHLLGTAPDCAVRVRADGVEPRHAMIVVSEHRTVVKALDPRTWVNEGPVSEMALRPGDRLSIGPLTFRVRAADSDELAAIAAANEQSFDDGTRHNVTTFVERPVKPTSSAEGIKQTSQSAQITSVPCAMPPVLDSVSNEFVGSAVATPFELPNAVEDGMTTKPAPSGHVVPQSPAVVRPAPSADGPTVKPARNHDTPPKTPTPTATLDLRLDEIEQKLAELQRPVSVRSTATEDVASQAEVSVAERRQLVLRQDELQQRADELVHQSQQLHERVARVAEREAEIERSQARLTLEYEQLSAAAEVTRKELDDEYARHRALWREWDTAYRRTSGELNGQLQSMEQRRTALLAEADHLAGERSELQRLQAEHERDRRVHAAERVQLTTDRAALQSLRAEFDTERQQHLVAVQEREARVAAERRALSVTQEELLGLRQQFEQDRSEFLAARSTEVLRRGLELREHVELREQLDLDHVRIQVQQREVDELRRAVEAERMAFASERDGFDSQLAAVAADRAELVRLRERLQQAEAGLAERKQTRESEPSVSTEVANSATTLPSASLDWLIEPYRNIHTPPPIPDNWSHESSFEDNATEDAVVASSPVDVLPLTPAIPATCDVPQVMESRDDEPRRTATETEFSLSDIVRGDRDVPEIGTASRVTAPAAASHRFWEDNTLYDTSVSAHSQQPVPSAFVASSNLMMSASAATPNVAQPLEAVAAIDDLARFAASTSFSDSSEDGSVAVWSQSLNAVTPDVVNPLETVGSTATVMTDDFLTVDETLADVNQRFGVPLPTHEVSPTADAVAVFPNWWSASDAAAVTVSEDHRILGDMSNDAASGLFSQTVDRAATWSPDVPHPSSPAQIDSTDPLSSLRAQLAQMFDLPAQTTVPRHETAESEEASAQDEDGSADRDCPADHDVMELTLIPTGIACASESRPEVDSNNEPDSGATSHSDSETTDSSRSVSPTNTAGSETTSGPENEIEAEDSIEACMAKLLSRTRGTEVSAGEVKSLAAAAAAATAASRQTDVSNSASTVADTPFDPADRSHLTAEPKHKQDRQAAREDLHSFRQVAHLSARSALARHTTKNLLSAVVAKSMLLGVSALATAAFLGAPLVGMSPQIWKGGACSLALLLSAIEVYRSWRQLRSWKLVGELSRKNNAKPAATSTPASEAAEPATAAESLPTATAK